MSDYVDVNGAAKILGCAPGSIYEMVKRLEWRHEYRTIKNKRRLLINSADVRSYKEAYKSQEYKYRGGKTSASLPDHPWTQEQHPTARPILSSREWRHTIIKATQRKVSGERPKEVPISEVWLKAVTR